MLRFQNIPEWYAFPEYLGEGDRIKLIGQSIAGDVVKAFGIEVAVAVMGSRYRSMAGIEPATRSAPAFPVQALPIIEESGQGTFYFEAFDAS